jgi:hypothetical protein
MQNHYKSARTEAFGSAKHYKGLIYCSVKIQHLKCRTFSPSWNIEPSLFEDRNFMFCTSERLNCLKCNRANLGDQTERANSDLKCKNIFLWVVHTKAYLIAVDSFLVHSKRLSLISKLFCKYYKIFSPFCSQSESIQCRVL